MSQYKTLLLLLLIGVFTRPSQCMANTPQAVDQLNQKAWDLRTSNQAEALRIANAALQLAQEINYAQGIGNSWNYIGLINRQEGYYEKARNAFLKSKEERIKLKDTIGIARVLSNLGTLEYQNGHLDLAIAWLIDAADTFEKLGIDSSMANVYHNIGNIYEGSGDAEKALAYFEKSLKYHESFDNDFAKAEVLQNIAKVYYFEDQLERSLEKALLARQLYRKLNNRKGEADILNILGSVALDRETYADAEKYFRQALKIYAEEGDRSLRVMDVNLNLGLIYIEMQKGTKALAALRQAQVLLQGRGGLEDHLYLTESLADAFQLLGQYDSALVYKNEMSAWQDSLYQLEKTEAIAEMQTRYETERKEKELAEEKLLSQKYANERRWLFQLLLLALALTALLFLFFRHRQRTAAIIAAQKAKIHEQEVEDLLQVQELKVVNAALEGQEVERKRIAKDLHDRLGSLLTTIKWQMDGFIEKETAPSENSLQKTSGLLDEAYHEVRRISHDMNSGVLAKFGLLPALEELRNTLTDSGSLQVELLSNGLNKRLDAPLEIMIYRIIQELVSNVLKHAQASHISIQVHRINQQLQVVIEDDGIGFELEKVSGGMGLKNVEARVQGMNGSLDVDSGKGGGSSIFIDLPLN